MILSAELSLKVVNLSGSRLRSFLVPKTARFYEQCNSITSRTQRAGLEQVPKPGPWPYKEKGYSNWRAWIEGTMKRFDDNSKIICIEGPPAVGKTAVAKYLAEEFEMLHLPMVTMDYLYINHYGYDRRSLDSVAPAACESCDEKRFRENPHHRNAPNMLLQYQELKTSQYLDALMHVFNTGQGVVIERCMFTDLAFAEASHLAGYLNKDELKGYYFLRSKAFQGISRPHLAIYLDASVDTVLNNFKKRGLGEEKVFHREYLTNLEEAYKRKALVEVEKHAELLVYDWNEPGDEEAIVEDIERINFERFSHREEKMKDWRFWEDADAKEKRWWYTHKKDHFMVQFGRPLYDCPRLWWEAEDVTEYERLLEEHESERYDLGFNPAMGDKVLTKVARQYCITLPDFVTDMLQGRQPKPRAGLVD